MQFSGLDGCTDLVCPGLQNYRVCAVALRSFRGDDCDNRERDTAPPLTSPSHWQQVPICTAVPQFGSVISQRALQAL